MTSINQTRSLRRKLLRIVFTVFLLLGVGILAAIAWVNTQTEHSRVAEMEIQVRKGIISKGRITAESHALALRGLVAENAFTDVQKLVQHAVEADPEIVYGLFVSAEGTPWAYVSPTTRKLDPGNPRAILEHWRELSLPPDSWKSTAPSEGDAEQFGQHVFEVSRPVVENGEVLGMVRYGFSTEPLREALVRVRADSKQALWRTLLWIALGIAVSTVAGFFFVSRAASRIVHPLQSLTTAAHRIAEGESGVRVHVETNDELQVLGQAFNNMQAANEEAMRNLSEAMEAAVEASRLKSEFVANMSHEIRTPMNGIIGMIRLILKMPLEGKLRRYAETVDKSAGALMTIINDVLDFSKMEAGKYTLQSVPFDPGTVLQEVAELQSGRAHDKGLELVYRCDPAVPHAATGDPDRYRQIVNNLISNAVKFSEEGEVFVELKVDSQDEQGTVLRTIVQDTGVGITSEDQELLFEAFSQVDGSMVRRHGGTGLGLVISKRLVEMMGGQIGVKSERGVGSTFWFTVRVTPSDAPVRPPRSGFPEGHRALVVEASRRWCRIIQEHMIAWGLTCSVHHDGYPALEDLGHNTYDLIVVGARLRDISIESFVKQMRQVPSARRIPVIVLTQLGENATLTEVESEVAAQVAKPLRLSELYERIVDAFAGNRQQASRPLLRTQRRMGPRQRILIVDDNEINQYVAMEQVEAAGFDADVASDGEEAVKRVKDRPYAAVLMDCQMPVMDGYTATRVIREWEGTRQHTPIIALTAHAMAGERDKVLSAGMDDYLSKPLKPHSLERMLKRYIGCDVAEESPEESSEESVVPTDLDRSLSRSPRLSSLFLARVPDTLFELEAAIGANDATRIRDRAHKLKGSCLAIGAEGMAKLAETLQFEAERGEIAQSSTRLKALREQFDQVAVLLRSELERAGSSVRAGGNSRPAPPA